jgi:DNA-binding FadR family transcriptional regulator
MKSKVQDELGYRPKALPRSCLIARDIGIQILSGRYKPGDLLNGEPTASLRLQVSRSTYREAMSILSAKGMLERRQNTGTRVTPREQWHWLDPEVLAWSFEFQHTDQSVGSILELCRAVEPEVAALAAGRRTAEELMDLRRALSQMQKSTGTQQASSERPFRAALFRSSHNVYLRSLCQIIDTAVSTIADKSPFTPGPSRAAISHYGDVYDAVAARDPVWARGAMNNLIAGTRADADFCVREELQGDQLAQQKG